MVAFDIWYLRSDGGGWREGDSVGKEAMPQMQDCAAQGHPARDLRKSEAQATARVGRYREAYRR
jgi:hypothetical protein